MNLTSLLDSLFCIWLAESLGHVLWQGCFLTALAMLGGYALRHRTARSRYAFYCSIMLLTTIALPMNLYYFSYDLAEREILPSTATANAPTQVANVTDDREEDARNEAVRTDKSDDNQPSDVSSSDVSSSKADTVGLRPFDEAAADSRQFQQPSASARLLSATSIVPPRPVILRWSAWIVVGYGLGILAMMLRLAFGIYGSARLKSGINATQHPHVQRVIRLAKQLDSKVAPMIGCCDRMVMPVVVGLIRPVILVPTSILTELSAPQIESLLLHELAHIRRYDHLMNFLQRLVESLLFFHPGVWWLSQRISIEREHCCDDLVLQWGSEPCNYAESLVRVSELRTRSTRQKQQLAMAGSVLAADGQRPSRLRVRVQRILGINAPGPNIGVSGFGSLLVIGLVLLAATVAATQTDGDLSKTKPNANSTAKKQGITARKQLVGVWLGTGAETIELDLKVDGKYESSFHRVPGAPAESPEQGVWILDGKSLTREVVQSPIEARVGLKIVQRIKRLDEKTLRLESVDGVRVTFTRAKKYLGWTLLSTAATGDYHKHPDLWHEVPPGSKSYEIHPNVAVVYSDHQGVVYDRRDKDLFVIQCDPIGSSVLTYYGPYRGNPHKLLALPQVADSAIKQLSLQLTLTSKQGVFKPGENVTLHLELRNRGETDLTVKDHLPLFGWTPRLFDEQGQEFPYTIPAVDMPVQIRTLVVPARKATSVGEYRFTLPEKLVDGTYSATQMYRVGHGPKQVELTSNPIQIRVGGPPKALRLGDTTAPQPAPESPPRDEPPTSSKEEGSAQINLAETQLELAQAEYERAKQLAKRGFISDRQLAAFELELAASKQQLADLRAQTKASIRDVTRAEILLLEADIQRNTAESKRIKALVDRGLVPARLLDALNARLAALVALRDRLRKQLGSGDSPIETKEADPNENVWAHYPSLSHITSGMSEADFRDAVQPLDLPLHPTKVDNLTKYVWPTSDGRLMRFVFDDDGLVRMQRIEAGEETLVDGQDKARVIRHKNHYVVALFVADTITDQQVVRSSNGRLVTALDFEETFRELSQNGLKVEPQVEIRAAKTMRTGEVQETVKLLQQAGFQQIRLATLPDTQFFVLPARNESGTVRGRIDCADPQAKDATFLVNLNHESTANQRGKSPAVKLTGNGAFEFRNVPTGKCQIHAIAYHPNAAANAGQPLEVAVERTIEFTVIDGQPFDVTIDFKD